MKGTTLIARTWVVGGRSVLRDAFAYSLAAGKRHLAVGALLVALSPLVVPLLAVVGYFVRVLDSPGAEPPPFDEWLELVADGAKLVVIAGSWFFTPMVFVALFYGIVFYHHLGEGSMYAMFIALFYYATYLYSIPAIVGRFARTGVMKEAFNVPAITPLWMDSEYQYRVGVGTAVFAGGLIGSRQHNGPT